MSVHRKRGVVASRKRLEKAMVEAGFKTQIALAKAIAKQEESTTVPKDLVSKVFRGVPVSPYNLQRVASVLGVEAYTLYQTSQESDNKKGNAGDSSSGDPIEESKLVTGVLEKAHLDTEYSTRETESDNGYSQTVSSSEFHSTEYLPQKNFFWIFIVSSFGLGLFFSVTYLLPEFIKSDEPLNLLDDPSFEHYSAILTVNDSMLSFADATAKAIDSDLVALTILGEKASKTAPLQLLQRYRADAVLEIVTQSEGRFWSIALVAWTNKGSTTLWNTSLSSGQFNLYMTDIANEVAKVVSLFFKQEAITINPKFGFNVSNEALAFYLEGRAKLDTTYQDEQAIHAQSRFSAAIRRDKDFAQAYAGLCEALILESWAGNEKIVLEDASKACSHALELAPSSPYVLAANLALFRSTASLKSALSMMKKALQNAKYNSAQMLYEIAFLKFEYSKESSEKALLLNEIELLSSKIISTYPAFWRIHHLLSLVDFHNGDISSAMNHIDAATHINRNVLLLTNLGTLLFCQGDIPEAKSRYQEAIQFFPSSPLGHEMLGRVYFFENELHAAEKSIKWSISLSDENNIHQTWGNLADVYRHMEQLATAKTYYQKALDIIHQDELLGLRSIEMDIYRLYYEISMLTSTERLSKIESHNKNLEELYAATQSHLSPATAIRIAVIGFLLRNDAVAKSSLNTAVSSCPVFWKSPDIVKLSNELKITMQ